MMDKTYHVLFLCTGNSARSIFAEALMNQLGGGIFKAFSAGSHPASSPHPLTLKVLKSQGFDISSLSSKSLLQYQQVDSPKMDFIFTLCDKMAGGCGTEGMPNLASVIEVSNRLALTFLSSVLIFSSKIAIGIVQSICP